MAATVAIVKCKDYEKERVFEAVHNLLEMLGEIGKFVKAGEKVLLKPNMLSAKEPERGITTHPVVLEAVVREVQSVGGEVWIGDSPSGAVKGLKRYWENTGFKDVADRTGARLVNFEAGGTVARTVKGEKYHFARAVFEADVVINLPKFKTHGLTLYTGAIKNLYGTLPGLQKATFHKLHPHPQNFSRVLVNVFSSVRPRLNLMDGILGMEGNGPATGNLRNVGLLLASEDGIALDTVASSIMGFKENEVDAIRLAGEDGVGENSVEKIEILGEKLDAVRLEDFSLPSNRLIRLVPEFLMKWVARFVWARPQADPEKCTGCGVCANSCPVHAIQMVDGRPVMDYNVCINCLCCNESCPEGAIVQQMSWLARRFG